MKPTLSLRPGKSDPRTHIEVREGESFEVWIGLSHPDDETSISHVELFSSDDTWIIGDDVEIEKMTGLHSQLKMTPNTDLLQMLYGALLTTY